MNKSYIIIPALFLALINSGCARKPKMSLSDLLEKSYLGKNVEVFFEDNGLAQSKYKMESGKTMYVWSSNDASFIAPTTAYNGLIYGNSFSALSRTIGGGIIDRSCIIRIIASPQKDVEKIMVEKSGSGNWHPSRCSEYFKKLKRNFQ